MTVTDCSIGTESTSAMETTLAATEKGVANPESGVGQLALLAGLCNEAEFDASTVNLSLQDRRINGNATDQAILRFAEGLSPVADMKQSLKTHFHLAFNSKNKFMIKVIAAVEPTAPAAYGTEEATIMIKGAPDILLPRCVKFLTKEGTSRDMRQVDQKIIEEVKDKWSRQGKRVILLARKSLPNEFFGLSTATREYEQALLEECTQGLELIGLVGIVDPPRQEIPEVVRTLRGAGIKIHMVTGDFKLTAQAIAAECGIITPPSNFVHDISALTDGSGTPSSTESEKHHGAGSITTGNTRAIVLSGPELATLDDDQWDVLCRYDEIVFARTTPEQKLRIVKEFQARDEIVGSKSWR